MANKATYRLDSKTVRLKLKVRRKPYYTQVGERLTLGYLRREAGPGSWVRRELISGTYRFDTFAVADDIGRADGRDILTFEQARAQATGAATARRSAKLTVREAIETYLTVLAARSTHEKEYRGRAEMHILPVLGATRVDRLTTEQIERWHAGLVADADPEARRRSQDSANRVLAILKAALNGAFKDAANGIESDAAWRRVKPFRAVGAPREDHFDPAQVRTLIAKAATFDPRFAELCEAGYLVGARLAELTGRDVRDFDAERGTLTIRTGKTGARVVTLTSEAVAFFKRLTNGKLPGAVLLPRADGARWQANQQTPRFARALRLAELPLTASFYALRHSWISRAIESGMPLSLVAEQAGTSLRMLESNYAKVLAATRRDVIERTAPKLRRVK